MIDEDVPMSVAVKETDLSAESVRAASLHLLKKVARFVVLLSLVQLHSQFQRNANVTSVESFVLNLRILCQRGR
jgi:hypothetical protein